MSVPLVRLVILTKHLPQDEPNRIEPSKRWPQHRRTESTLGTVAFALHHSTRSWLSPVLERTGCVYNPERYQSVLQLLRNPDRKPRKRDNDDGTTWARAKSDWYIEEEERDGVLYRRPPHFPWRLGGRRGICLSRVSPLRRVVVDARRRRRSWAWTRADVNWALV